MRLTYWIANCMNDADCYSIRATTRKEVVRQLNECPDGEYGVPRKVTIDYDSAFDLLTQCVSEGGVFEGLKSTFLWKAPKGAK